MKYVLILAIVGVYDLLLFGSGSILFAAGDFGEAVGSWWQNNNLIEIGAQVLLLVVGGQFTWQKLVPIVTKVFVPTTTPVPVPSPSPNVPVLPIPSTDSTTPIRDMIPQLLSLVLSILSKKSGGPTAEDLRSVSQLSGAMYGCCDDADHDHTQEV